MIIYLKRLKSSKFVLVKPFPMYGGIGVSTPSLHRESTDSLILCTSYVCMYIPVFSHSISFVCMEVKVYSSISNTKV